MAVSLAKGGNVSLSKEAPGLKTITVGLGWDPRVTDGQAFDLDASVFMVDSAGKVVGDAGFIFYNNKVSADGSVVHQGDNTTGAGDGDDLVQLTCIENHQGSHQLLGAGNCPALIGVARG
jgi:tellurium resistance protein TerD